MTTAGAAPLLLFDRMSAGMEFTPSRFPTSAGLVARYMAITGDRQPEYHDPEAARAAGFEGPIVPLGLSGVWARRAYQSGVRMPSGGVIARMSVHGLAPALVGETLLLQARVAELDPADPRRRVVIHTGASVARDGRSVAIGMVVVDARWSAQTSGSGDA